MTNRRRIRRGTLITVVVVACFATTGFGGFGRAANPAIDTPARLAIDWQTFFLPGPADFELAMTLLDADLNLGPVLSDQPSPTANQPRVTITAYPPVIDPADVTDRPSADPVGTVSVPLADVVERTDTGWKVALTLGRSSVAVVSPNAPTLDALNIEGPGLYPLEIRVDDADGMVASTATFVERTGSTVAPADQLTAGLLLRVNDVGPMPSPEEVSAARTEVEQVIQIANTTELPLTVAVPPATIASALDDDSDILRRLRRALDGQTVLTAPAYALEPDAAIGASIEESFRESWSAGLAMLSAYFPQSKIDSTTIIIDTPTSVAGIGLIDDLGIDLAVVPDSVYEQAQGQIGAYTDPGLLVNLESTDGRLVPAAVGSPALIALDASDDTGTPVERSIRLLAQLNAQQGSPKTEHRSAFLMTPEIGVPDPVVVASIDALSTAGNGPPAERPMVWAPIPNLASITHQHVVDDAPLSISWSVQPTNVVVNRLSHIDAAEQVIHQTVSMLPPTDRRRESWALRVQSAESTLLTDQQAGQLIEQSLAQAERLRQSVPPPEPFQFTVAGGDTTLRFQLTNTAATPLDVVFVLNSDRLIAPQYTPVRLTPNAVTDVPIEVSSRSNGTASVRVGVQTPDGLPLFAPVEMDGRVSSFGGLGKVATVGSLLVLATWWLTFLSRRHQKSHASADKPAAD